MIVIHDQQQTGTHSRARGVARMGCCAFAPAADKPQATANPNRRKGFLPNASVGAICNGSLQRTDRRLGSNLDGGLFPRECCSNSLAKILTAQSLFDSLPERNECHLKYPLCASSNASTHTGKRFSDEQKDTAAGVRND